MLTGKAISPAEARGLKQRFQASWGSLSGKATTYLGTKRGIINRLKRINYMLYVDDLRITDSQGMLVYGVAEEGDVVSSEFGTFFSQKEWTEATGCILRTAGEVGAVRAEIEHEGRGDRHMRVMITKELAFSQRIAGDTPTMSQLMLQGRQMRIVNTMIDMTKAGLNSLQVEAGTVRYDERFDSIPEAYVIHSKNDDGTWTSTLNVCDFSSVALFEGELSQTRIQAMLTLAAYIGRKTLQTESLLSKQLEYMAQLLVRTLTMATVKDVDPLIHTIVSGETVYLNEKQRSICGEIVRVLAALSLIKGQTMLAVEHKGFVFTSTPRLRIVRYENCSWVKSVTQSHDDNSSFTINFTVAGLSECSVKFSDNVSCLGN